MSDQQVEQSQISVGEKRIAVQKFDHEVGDEPALFEEIVLDYRTDGSLKKKTVKVYDRHQVPPQHLETHVFDYDTNLEQHTLESEAVGDSGPGQSGPGKVGDAC